MIRTVEYWRAILAGETPLSFATIVLRDLQKTPEQREEDTLSFANAFLAVRQEANELTSIIMKNVRESR